MKTYALSEAGRRAGLRVEKLETKIAKDVDRY